MICTILVASFVVGVGVYLGYVKFKKTDTGVEIDVTTKN